MAALTMEEIREVELGCLRELDRVCRAHGLRYALAYGTLIGAMRHKGFIPWDDDIDVYMPRSDYEELYRLFRVGELGSRYSLLIPGRVPRSLSSMSVMLRACGSIFFLSTMSILSRRV